MQSPKPDVLLQQAVDLHRTGRVDEAVRAYKKILRKDARAFGALNLLGLAEFQRGQLPQAAEALSRAIRLAPDLPNIDYNFARVLQAQGRFRDALAHYEKAVARAPQDAEATVNLGSVLAALGRRDDAIEQYRRALSLDPRRADAWHNLGNALKASDRFEEALEAYREALPLNPNQAETLRSAAYALFRLDRFDEALPYAEKAVAIQPRTADNHLMVAVVLAALGRDDEAVAAYDRAIACDPKAADAPFNKAVLLLSRGRFAEGWQHFHARWRITGAVQRRREYREPLWAGERVDGALLVWAEQGLGDQVLMSSMIPDACAFADKVVLEVDPRLVPLLGRSFPAVTVVPQREALYDGPVAAHCALGDLGRILRPDVKSFAKTAAGYVRVDETRAAALRSRLHEDGKRVIGLSWSSANREIGRSKSARLADFAPVLRLPDCRFIDLQYGDTSRDRAEVEAATGVCIDHVDEIDNTNDIDGLAALMAACDAVVTVSNTNAHLAAAQGKPTFVMLSDATGLIWYWMKRGDRTPFYERAKLFRRRGDQGWDALAANEVVPALTECLERLR